MTASGISVMMMRMVMASRMLRYPGLRAGEALPGAVPRIGVERGQHPALLPQEHAGDWGTLPGLWGTA